jgi:competence protein ComEC
MTTRRLTAGSELTYGPARIRVLNPPSPDWERRRVRNDDSLVMEVIFGDVAILLTGDAGAEVEQQIVHRLTPARVRILKVGHHGSRTSTSKVLIDAWKPQIAIVSCGRGNRFGHPAAEVIQRLEAAGARIYRTDRDGQVTADTDGKTFDIRRFVEARNDR